MKIVHLTPGTGNFHCGSCHRDNHLVKALRAAGHQAIMAPLYLPLVTDDAPASESTPLFAGGINMFLQQKFRIFRKTPRWLDKLFDARRLLKAAVKRASMTSARDLGEMTLESLRGAGGRQAKEWGRLVEWIRGEKPDVVSLSNGLLAGLASSIRESVRVPVICSLQGEDSFLDTLPEPWRGQCWQLLRELSPHVDRFVASSDWYAGQMRERLALPQERIVRIHNGLNLSGYEPAAAPPAAPTVGFLARLIKGKGLDQIVDAFLLLKERGKIPSARLLLGGTLTSADEPFIMTMKARIRAAGREEHVQWRPNLNLQEKIAFLQSLSVFCVPATYGEAFGLYVLEALACGVPVVEPDHAGLGEITRLTGGGELTPANDIPALAAALENLLLQPEKCRQLASAGRENVLAYFSAERMAREFAELCRSVAEGAAAPH